MQVIYILDISSGNQTVIIYKSIKSMYWIHWFTGSAAADPERLEHRPVAAEATFDSEVSRASICHC